MKIFILTDVSQLTHNYHERGGLIIIAKDLRQAKKLVAEQAEKNEGRPKVHDDEWKDAIVHGTDATKADIFIFPDAGCC